MNKNDLNKFTGKYKLFKDCSFENDTTKEIISKAMYNYHQGIKEELKDTNPSVPTEPKMILVWESMVEKGYNNIKGIENLKNVVYILIPSPEHDLNQIINFEKTMVDYILKYNKEAKFYLGTSSLNSRNYKCTLDMYKHSQFKKLTDLDSVVGIYYNQESLYGNKTDKNKQRENMINFTNYCRKNNLFSLNIPYYGYGTIRNTIISDVKKTIKLNCFDYVIIQPHFYFNGNNDEKYNIEVEKNLKEVCDIVTSNYTSITKVGIEIEMNWAYHKNVREQGQDKEYIPFRDRLKAEEEACGNFLGKYPIALYWDGGFNYSEAKVKEILKA